MDIYSLSAVVVLLVAVVFAINPACAKPEEERANQTVRRTIR